MYLLKHGRLKVKTTAEQQEAKRKEREEKLKIYKAASARAFEKVMFATCHCWWMNEMMMQYYEHFKFWYKATHSVRSLNSLNLYKYKYKKLVEIYLLIKILFMDNSG